MRVLHISTFDLKGGAGIAAFRLHRALVDTARVDSRMSVMFRTASDPLVYGPVRWFERAWARLAPGLSGLRAKLAGKRGPGIFSAQELPGWLVTHPEDFRPDVVHVHWIGGGFLSIEDIALFHVPVVLTMHDMWAFTGGCHCDEGCGRFSLSCGLCPMLGAKREDDLSRRVFERKARAWRNLDMTFVAPSRWLETCALAAPLTASHRVVRLPNCVDTEVFRPVDRSAARDRFGIDESARILLFGANDFLHYRVKGFHLLAEVLPRLACREGMDGIELVIFGATGGGRIPDVGLHVRHVGSIRDTERLAALYSAADVMVMPSLQDNLPNTVVEAMACGTPVVAFDVGGLPDLVDSGSTGRLVRAFDLEEMAVALADMFAMSRQRLEEMGRRCRDKITGLFSMKEVARRHIELYEELLS